MALSMQTPRTIEVRHNAVVQIRGRSNRDPSDSLRLLEDC